jgi:hypothetical protein
MKKLSLGLALAILLSCKNRIIQKPVLNVTNKDVDLGAIKYDSSYKIDYIIANVGAKDLVIDTVTSSCGCSVPKINKKVIRSSDTTLVSVEFKPVDSGKFSKSIVMKSNTDSVYTVLKFRGRAVR